MKMRNDVEVTRKTKWETSMAVYKFFNWGFGCCQYAADPHTTTATLVTGNTACTDLLMNTDHKPNTKSVW